MAEKLTDEKRKLILAHYAETQNYKETARHFGVADQTVRRICQSEPGLSRKVEQKRAENTANMIEFMESRKQKAQGVIDGCLSILPEKLKEASAAQVATVMGITIDKFLKSTDCGVDTKVILANIRTLEEIVSVPAPNRSISDFE